MGKTLWVSIKCSSSVQCLEILLLEILYLFNSIEISTGRDDMVRVEKCGDDLANVQLNGGLKLVVGDCTC